MNANSIINHSDGDDMNDTDTHNKTDINGHTEH